jgi:hypothetical protein
MRSPQPHRAGGVCVNFLDSDDDTSRARAWLLQVEVAGGSLPALFDALLNDFLKSWLRY